MPRHGWRHWPGPPGWDSGAEWWSRPGARAWRGFGRRVFVGFLAVFLFAVLALLTLGAIIATVIVGVTQLSTPVAVAVTPLVVLAIAILAARSVARTWRPVGALIRAAGSLADGDYSARVSEAGSPAMRPVVTSFNEMARRLESADDQRRRLLADLGHELRTPLTVIRGEIEAMLDGVHRPDPDHLELLLDEVAVMERLLGDLRTLSLAEAGALTLELEPTDVADLVSDVADAHRRVAGAAGVTIDVGADPTLEDVVVDPVRMREVLSNLVINSLRAMPEGGSLTLTTHATDGQVAIEVTDTGTGIDPTELNGVFDRFRKGSTSSGSGLGLTISRDLVEAHGGTISIESTPGVGTAVRILFPLIRAGA